MRKELYSQMLNRILEGVMFHEQISELYDFLNLKGYAHCHHYHFHKEMKSYHKLRQHINEMESTLFKPEFNTEFKVIESFKKYSKDDYSGADKSRAVEELLSSWIKWEKETKKVFETLKAESEEYHDYVLSHMLEELILDVCEEVRKAEGYYRTKRDVDFSIAEIIREQEDKCCHYREKIEETFKIKRAYKK